MMDPTLKAAWIKALRSGCYRQGVGALKRQEDDGVSFCCIGVLADVLGYESRVESDGCYAFAIPGLSGYRAVGMLPSLTLHEKGLSDHAIGKLVTLNDDERASFDRIADHIEEAL